MQTKNLNIASVCGTVTCENGGVCTDEGWRKTCSCGPGWTASLCNVDLDECASNPCANKGICSTNSFGNYTCTCLAAFTGDTCDTQIGSCGLQTPAEQAERAT